MPPGQSFLNASKISSFVLDGITRVAEQVTWLTAVQSIKSMRLFMASIWVFCRILFMVGDIRVN